MSKNMLSVSRRNGFSLVELLCVIAIISIIVGMLLPAVQAAREASRAVVCRDHLRNLTLACHAYEGTHRAYPPGTLGFSEPVWITTSDIPQMLNNPNHPFYFRKQQHTSWFVFLLPHLEQTVLADRLPNICTAVTTTYETYRQWHVDAPGWLDGFADVRDVSATVVPVFLCPSDAIEQVPKYNSVGLPLNIGSQPVYLTAEDTDLLLGYELTHFQLDPAPTNYLGCTGAYSGGHLPTNLPATLRSMPRYQGVFQSRARTRTASMIDGLSNTILIGESIGFARSHQRSAPVPWFFHGLGRARSALEWESNSSWSYPELEILGDRIAAYPVGFASMHPDTCNFAWADGSVQSMSRSVTWPVLYALSGIADADVTSWD